MDFASLGQYIYPFRKSTTKTNWNTNTLQKSNTQIVDNIFISPEVCLIKTSRRALDLHMYKKDARKN